MVVSTLPGTGARKSAPQPGGISARTASMSVARASARYRSRARASHGRSTASFGCPGGTASRRSAWVSSHSGDTANRLMVRSSLPTSIRSATVTSFRPQTKEYAPGRRAHRMAYMTAPAPARQPDAARQDPPARATYRSVFAVREFRVMAAAMFMYVLGFEFEVLGLSVLVFAQTESALWTALAFSAGFAPQAARRRAVHRARRPAAAAPGHRGGPADPGRTRAGDRMVAGAAHPGHAGAGRGGGGDRPGGHRRPVRPAPRAP